MGDSASVPPAGFGLEIRRLNPFRVESTRGVIILWMGADIGYGINPNSDGFPSINMIRFSQSEWKNIYQLQRTRRTPWSCTTLKAATCGRIREVGLDRLVNSLCRCCNIRFPVGSQPHFPTLASLTGLE
jgi:hypothetical protein